MWKGIKNYRPPVFCFFLLFLGTLTLVLHDALLGSYVHSATRGCKHWLLEFLLLFYYLQPDCTFWPLTPEIDKAVSSLHLLFTELNFLCLEPFCVNPKRWLSCGENPSRSAVCEILQWARHCLIVTSIPFLLHSDDCFEIQEVVFTMLTFLNASSCFHMIGWLGICVNKQYSIQPNNVAAEQSPHLLLLKWNPAKSYL